MLEKIKETTEFLKKKGIDSPQIGIVLGTGLGEFIEHIKSPVSIPYSEIPHFAQATVEFHHGKLVYGNVNGKKVLAMQGRFHYYEGHSIEDITFPIRVMKVLGVKQLFLSNAAGGINTSMKKGDLVLLDDHINLLPENPLRGNNLDELGSRFPDMCEPYNSSLNSILLKNALKTGVELKKGVYAAVQGPNLETRAEYRYLRIIGADMVGMSTIPEVIVANHMTLPCAAVSVITDECDPDNLKPINIPEIIEIAKQADKKLSKLMCEVIKDL